jgi:predicted metal-dependent HD superfamily phosphohydrolase
LQCWEKTRNLFQEPTLAGFALFYHEAIYDPRRIDNEAASAELARKDLVELGLDSKRISQVCALVRATDHKTQTDHPDADLVIDIDLAILGTDSQTYQRYVTAVRREYAHIDETGWRIGRAKVLQGFLNKPRIFANFFFDECERKARLNLVQELREVSD